MYTGEYRPSGAGLHPQTGEGALSLKREQAPHKGAGALATKAGFISAVAHIARDWRRKSSSISIGAIDDVALLSYRCYQLHVTPWHLEIRVGQTLTSPISSRRLFTLELSPDTYNHGLVVVIIKSSEGHIR